MSQPKSSDTANAEFAALKEAYTSLESRLKEEASAHARTKLLLQERIVRADDGDKLKLVLEHMPVMMNAFDRDGICVAWNGECERVTGYSAEEMVGAQNIHELTMPDPTYRARMLELWSTKRDARDREVELTAKDGRILTIAWSNESENFAIRDWSTWSIGVDVTERNRVEAALKKSRGELERKVALRTLELDNANALLRVEKKHLQGVLDNIADGVATIDEAGVVESFNPAAEKMFGLAAADVIGKNVSVLMPELDGRQHDDYLKGFLDTGEGKILGAAPVR